MKKITAILTVFLCLLLCACGGGGAQLKEGDVTLIKSDENGAIFFVNRTVEGASLFDAMRYLEGDVFAFTYENGAYGAEIKSVNGVFPKEREFWGIYTTLQTHGGVVYSNMEYGSVAYENTSLASASYGCSFMPLIKGHFYALALGGY